MKLATCKVPDSSDGLNRALTALVEGERPHPDLARRWPQLFNADMTDVIRSSQQSNVRGEPITAEEWDLNTFVKPLGWAYMAQHLPHALGRFEVRARNLRDAEHLRGEELRDGTDISVSRFSKVPFPMPPRNDSAEQGVDMDDPQLHVDEDGFADARLVGTKIQLILLRLGIRFSYDRTLIPRTPAGSGPRLAPIEPRVLKHLCDIADSKAFPEPGLEERHPDLFDPAGIDRADQFVDLEKYIRPEGWVRIAQSGRIAEGMLHMHGCSQSRYLELKQHPPQVATDIPSLLHLHGIPYYVQPSVKLQRMGVQTDPAMELVDNGPRPDLSID